MSFSLSTSAADAIDQRLFGDREAKPDFVFISVHDGDPDTFFSENPALFEQIAGREGQQVFLDYLELERDTFANELMWETAAKLVARGAKRVDCLSCKIPRGLVDWNRTEAHAIRPILEDHPEFVALMLDQFTQGIEYIKKYLDKGIPLIDFHTMWPTNPYDFGKKEPRIGSLEYWTQSFVHSLENGSPKRKIDFITGDYSSNKQLELHLQDALELDSWAVNDPYGADESHEKFMNFDYMRLYPNLVSSIDVPKHLLGDYLDGVNFAKNSVGIQKLADRFAKGALIYLDVDNVIEHEPEMTETSSDDEYVDYLVPPDMARERKPLGQKNRHDAKAVKKAA